MALIFGSSTAPGNLDHVLPIDGVGDRPPHLDVVEGRLGDLREQVPGAGIRVLEDVLLHARITLQLLQVARLEPRQVQLVVLVGKRARLHGNDRNDGLLHVHVLGAEEVGILPEHHLLVVLPLLQDEGAVGDDVGGFGPLVAMLLDGAPVRGQRRQVRREDREVASRPLERDLKSPVVLRLDADLVAIGDLLLVEGFAVLDVVEEGGIGRLGLGVELALPRPLEVAGAHRRVVGPPAILADGERPDRTVLVALDLGGQVRLRHELGVEHHETGEQKRHARAVQVLVVIVAGWVVLPGAATAQAQDLLPGKLLAGAKLERVRGLGPGGEAQPSEGGHGAHHLEEVTPAKAQ